MSDGEQNRAPSQDESQPDGPSPTSQIHNVPDEPPGIWPTLEQTNLGKVRGLITCPQVPDPVLRLVWRVREQEDPETHQACWQKVGAFQREFGWNWEKFEVTRTKAVVLGLLWEYDRPGQTTLRRVPHPLPGEEELEQRSEFLDWVSSQESDPSWYDKNDRKQLRELRRSGCTTDEMRAVMGGERLRDFRGARKSESGGARKSESGGARKSESGVPGNPGHDLGDGLRGRDSGTVLHGEVVKRAGRKPSGSPDPSPRKQPEKSNGSSADGQGEATADQDECVPRERAGRLLPEPHGGWVWVRENGHRNGHRGETAAGEEDPLALPRRRAEAVEGPVVNAPAERERETPRCFGEFAPDSDRPCRDCAVASQCQVHMLGVTDEFTVFDEETAVRVPRERAAAAGEGKD